MEHKKIEDILEKDGVYVSTIGGYSMYPMLRNRRDTVVIQKYEGRLKKFDVPLYKVGDRYILHRIIKVLPDSYIIRGDNTEQKEYGNSEKNILGVLTTFYRDEKEINMNGFVYKAYVYFWHYTFIFRRVYKSVYYRLRRRRIVDAGNDIVG